MSDSVAKVEGQALPEKMASDRYLICSVVRLDILTTMPMFSYGTALAKTN